MNMLSKPNSYHLKKIALLFVLCNARTTQIVSKRLFEPFFYTLRFYLIDAYGEFFECGGPTKYLMQASIIR